MNESVSYDSDFHAWALRNARLLRDGRLGKLDVEAYRGGARKGWVQANIVSS
jgi:hypothetical protein